MSDAKPVSVELLRELRMFTGLTDQQLGAIAALAHLEVIATGEPVVRAGGTAESLHIVVAGKCSLCVSRGADELCLLTLTRGELIGWSAMLDTATWSASATALKPSSVVVIDGTGLRRLCDADHDIGYHIMRHLFTAVAARLHDTRLQLLDMYGDA